VHRDFAVTGSPVPVYSFGEVFIRKISSTIYPGDIQQVVSVGRLQPMALYLWQLQLLAYSSRWGKYELVSKLYTVFK
jgi:hypothetical protein